MRLNSDGTTRNAPPGTEATGAHGAAAKAYRYRIHACNLTSMRTPSKHGCDAQKPKAGLRLAEEAVWQQNSVIDGDGRWDDCSHYL